MATSNLPTPEYLRQCLRYEDGKLFWLVRPREHFSSNQHWRRWNTLRSGKEAGSIMQHPRGGPRCHIKIGIKQMPRYRIVWAMHKNEWPKQIDHENRNQLDDRIENLRLATNSQNRANILKQSNNTSGYKGVTWNRVSKKWQVRLGINGKRLFLGEFFKIDDARRAYDKAAKEAFGGFACIAAV